jgi:methylated-DNA-[protein]-cysteine S-methyltransferase
MQNKQTTFTNQVYDLVCQIPKGYVSTYKLIAAALGKSGASQAVGTALSKNPKPFSLFSNNSNNTKDLIPCHRVIASNGSISGFLGDKSLNSVNVQNKLRLLQNEGVEFVDGHISDKSKIFSNFKK